MMKLGEQWLVMNSVVLRTGMKLALQAGRSAVVLAAVR